ncbi:MAG: hypothetical protein ACKO0N_07800, partial [Planctomycetota bacterium]
LAFDQEAIEPHLVVRLSGDQFSKHKKRSRKKKARSGNRAREGIQLVKAAARISKALPQGSEKS